MKKFCIEIECFKNKKKQWSEIVFIVSENKDIAKQIAKQLESSTNWSMDISPKPKLNTFKEIKDKDEFQKFLSENNLNENELTRIIHKPKFL